MTASAPPSADCQILQFKLLCKLKTRHDISKIIYRKPTNLVAISAVHGLTFVGEHNALKVVVTSKLFDETRNLNTKTLEDYLHRNIILPASPTHVDINAEHKLLAVAFIYNDVPILRIYVIDDFFAEEVKHFSEIRLSSTERTFITDLSWNPGIPNILACCVSDGSLSTYSINSNDSFEMKSLPKESCSVCVCWSPKGKQLVIGNSDGYLTQYLPELKAVRNIPPPSGLFPKTCTLCSIKWISNFQFIGVYKTPEQSFTDDEEIKSCVVVVNAPKNGPVLYVNYDDVCFSGGTDRPVQFYFSHISAWNLIFVSSSNSLEVAVLSLSQDNQTWVVWNLEPEVYRLTLPFLKSGEAFPVGVAIDYTVSIQTSIDDKVISMPTLYVMTCEGLLCVYLINFLNPGAPDICTPAATLPPLQYFSLESIHNAEAEQIQSDVIGSSHSFGSGNSKEITHIGQSTSQLQEATTSMDASFKTEILVPELRNDKAVQPAIPHDRIVHGDHLLTLKSSMPNTPYSLSNLNEAVGVMKKTESSRLRLEMVKKLKKRASVFENDIQEIKYLVNKINGCSEGADNRIFVQFASLNRNAEKLAAVNLGLRNDVDLIRISIIEVFSCVQDIKSKLFQFVNPGYQSLAGIKDIDPVNSKNMKSIQSTIHYLQTQVEKANKQLDDMWFQFIQNPTIAITKVPILENVYETMVKQQKILGFLKLQAEKLEKRFNSIVHRLRRNCLIQDLKLPANLPWSKDRMMNENLPLDELTKKTLNIRALADGQPDPKQLALQYSFEHAKRFHLSFCKEARLQELHSTNSITHIQSNRLQRLKKKSLIVLSKKMCKQDTNHVVEKEKMTQSIDRDVVSPFDLDEQLISTKSDKLISSTPLKCKEVLHYPLENIPSREATSFISSVTNITAEQNQSLTPRMIATISKLDKVEPLSQDFVSKNRESTVITTDQSKMLVAQIPAARSAPPLLSTPSSFTGKHLDEETKSEISTTSIFSNFSLPQPSSRMAIVAETETTTTLASPMPTMSPKNDVADLTRSIFQDPLLSSCAASGSSSSLSVSQFTAASTVASDCSGVKVSTMINPMFSFAQQKSETGHSMRTPSSPSPAAANLTTSSIFSGKPLTTTMKSKSVLSPVGAPLDLPAPNSVTSGQILNKTFSSDASKFVSFSENSFPRAISSAVPVTTVVSESTSPSTTSAKISSAPIASSPPIFENTSLFGDKLAPTTNNVINSLNFGSMLSSSLFSKKKNDEQLGLTTPANTATKESAFTTFSFAGEPLSNVSSSLTITEVTNCDKKESDGENVVSKTDGGTQREFFNFATPSLSFLSSTSSANLAAAADFGTTTNSIISVTSATISSFVCSAAITNNTVASSTTNSSPMTTTVTIPTVTTPPKSSSETNTFNKSSSFFGDLRLGTPASVTTDRTNTSAVSIFGKAPLASVSSVPSLFGDGTSVFPQTTNITATAVDTAVSQSGLVFQSENATSQLFGQGAASKNKNLFTEVTSAGNFQNSSGSIFSSGSSVFANNASFETRPSTQASTFGSTSGASVFGSNLSTSFSSSGFSSPSPFSGNLQEQQPSGFGSPPTFSSIFNKPGSGFSAFGSAPTFGGSPAFGISPSKVFGQTPANIGTFGTAAVSQQPTEFTGLANETTLSFGNLAQQQQPSGFGSAPSFCNNNAHSTFGSPANFGSSSFSSWR